MTDVAQKIVPRLLRVPFYRVPDSLKISVRAAFLNTAIRVSRKGFRETVFDFKQDSPMLHMVRKRKHPDQPFFGIMNLHKTIWGCPECSVLEGLHEASKVLFQISLETDYRTARRLAFAGISIGPPIIRYFGYPFGKVSPSPHKLVSLCVFGVLIGVFSRLQLPSGYKPSDTSLPASFPWP